MGEIVAEMSGLGKQFATVGAVSRGLLIRLRNTAHLF